ncbi:hypothetical protein [Ruegeria sp. MALMAid1280]|uniref:hypothetical protein n=1 Tax=Ruegeria sp. MALMAid1280 TaxID=3411634 RepID=UPI003BA08CAB
MNTQSNQSNSGSGKNEENETCGSLEDQVEKLNTSAAAGAFDKTAQAKLTDIAKGADAALQKYKDPANGYDALVQRWRKQHERVEKIREHLQNCYPDWDYMLKECVCCTVIQPLADMRKQLRKKLGKCEIALDDAAYCFTEAEAQLDAWKDITGWLKKRMDTNDELIEEICKLDKCEDHGFALYIFFFELLRQHSRLMPCETCTEDRYDPVRWYCCVDLDPCCDLTGYPWLIDPDEYKDKLGEAACNWRNAGKAKAEAEANLAWIDELRKQLGEDSKPENRRAKAKQYLKDCKPGTNGGRSDDEPGDDCEEDPDPKPKKDECHKPDEKDDDCKEPPTCEEEDEKDQDKDNEPDPSCPTPTQQQST